MSLPVLFTRMPWSDFAYYSARVVENGQTAICSRGALAVDKNEDAESLGFNSLQDISTSSAQQLETKGIENRPFRVHAGIRLGRRGSGVQIAPPRPT